MLLVTVIQYYNQTNCINCPFRKWNFYIYWNWWEWKNRRINKHWYNECVYFINFILFLLFSSTFWWCWRYGANMNPKDAGELPIIAILDKLVESPQPQLHVELCLKILLKTVPSIEMPYKVCFVCSKFNTIKHTLCVCIDHWNLFHHYHFISPEWSECK